MAQTFNKVALPAERIAACVDAITSHVLDGSYARWRYGEGNPVGARRPATHRPSSQPAAQSSRGRAPREREHARQAVGVAQ